MKKYILLLLLLMATASYLHAQAGVYLYINNITTGAGSAGVHVDETMITSEQHGSAISITTSGGGIPTPSKPTFSEFVFSKTFDVSSLRLQNLVLSGGISAIIEIRYYNSQDILVYSIKLENAYVTSHSSANDGSGCPTGCQSIFESYSVQPTSKIAYRNLATNPNQVLTYDLKLQKSTFTQ